MAGEKLVGEAAGKTAVKTVNKVKDIIGGLFGGGSKKGATTAVSDNLPVLWTGKVAPTRPFSNVASRLGATGTKINTFLSKPRGVVGTVLGLGGIGVAAGVGKSLYDVLTGRDNAPTGSFSVTPTGPTYYEQMLGGPTEASLLEQLYQSPAFTQQVSAPNYAGMVAASNENVRKGLEDYLTKTEGLGKESAKAIAGAYADLAKGTAALGEQQQVRGQDVAAEIDRLYQQLGLTEANLAAGGGVSGEATGISGLAPMGGEMATAQQTTPTYGASLADFLGREATIGGQALQQQALSQAAQGAGTASGLQNMIALASAQQRFAADQAAADRLAQAQMADAETAAQLEAQRIAMAQDQAARMFEAQRLDEQNLRQVRATLSTARSDANIIWDGATGAVKRQLEATYGKGAEGRTRFRAMATENPSILTSFVQQ
jgi:hypothetical protein